jgi:hypothetical protein
MMKCFARVCGWAPPVWASFRQAKIDECFRPGADSALPLVFLGHLLTESPTATDDMPLLFNFLAAAPSPKAIDLLRRLLEATRAFPPECGSALGAMLSLTPTAVVAANETLQTFPVDEVAELFTNPDPTVARTALEALLHVGKCLAHQAANVSADLASSSLMVRPSDLASLSELLRSGPPEFKATLHVLRRREPGIHVVLLALRQWGRVIVSRLADLRRRVAELGELNLSALLMEFDPPSIHIPDVLSHDVLRPLILLKRRSPEQFRAIENDIPTKLLHAPLLLDPGYLHDGQLGLDEGGQ